MGTPVHPNLFVPELPPVTKCPDPPPVWETDEDIAAIVKLLRSMGCRMDEARMVEPMKKGSGTSQPVKQNVASDSRSFISGDRRRAKTRSITWNKKAQR